MVSDVVSWFAVYVKSRHEFIASYELQGKGIQTFLPSVVKLRQWKDRRKAVEFPLFPGYFFVQIPAHPERFINVLKTRGVVTFVSLVPGQPTPAEPEEIDSLRLMLNSGKEMDIYPYLKEGTRVRVRIGPLRSAAGVIAKKGDDYMFIVNIDILGRSVGVKIYADEIEAA
jgi:transcription antitermination factor NusG